MTNKARQKAEYTKIKKELFKLLDDFNVNDNFVDDPKFETIRDIVIKNRMSYSEMIELYEKTYPDEK